MLKAFLKVLSIALVAIIASTSAIWAFQMRGTVIKNASDSWVWVTFYNSNGDIGPPAFCVAPGQTRDGSWRRSGGNRLEKLRFEMTTTNCAHPRYADLWQDFSGIVGFDITGSHKTGFHVRRYACHGSRQCY